MVTTVLKSSMQQPILFNVERNPDSNLQILQVQF